MIWIAYSSFLKWKNVVYQLKIKIIFLNNCWWLYSGQILCSPLELLIAAVTCALLCFRAGVTFSAFRSVLQFLIRFNSVACLFQNLFVWWPRARSHRRPLPAPTKPPPAKTRMALSLYTLTTCSPNSSSVFPQGIYKTAALSARRGLRLPTTLLASGQLVSSGRAKCLTRRNTKVCS